MIAILERSSWLELYLVTLAAFTLGCIAALVLIRIFDRLLLFKGVQLTNVRLLDFSMNGSMIQKLTAQGLIENKTQRPAYVLMKRATFSMQDKTRSDIDFPQTILMIPAQSSQTFNFPTVKELDATNELRGKSEVEFHYGPSEESLKYTYECVLEPYLLGTEVAPGTYDVRLTSMIKSEQHTRR